MKLAQKRDFPMLLQYLKEGLPYTIFMIADIEKYGFESPFMTIYLGEQEGRLASVFLRFYNNLVLAGEKSALDIDEFRDVVMRHKIRTVMGKYELIACVAPFLEEGDPVKNEVYYLLNEEKLLTASDGIVFATLKDVREIHEFLVSIEGFSVIYKDEEMIRRRLQSGEGLHVFIRENGRIVAHANTAATSAEGAMLGGIGTCLSCRHKGYARKLVAFLSSYLLGKNIRPCAFSSYAVSDSLFTELGFEVVGEWGTISLSE